MILAAQCYAFVHLLTKDRQILCLQVESQSCENHTVHPHKSTFSGAAWTQMTTHEGLCARPSFLSFPTFNQVCVGLK